MKMNEVSDRTNVEVMPACSPALTLPPDAALALVAERLVAQAAADGVALTGKDGLLSDLVGQVLQGALEVEMADHLGYEAHAVEDRGSGNPRNGYYPKTVRTERRRCRGTLDSVDKFVDAIELWVQHWNENPHPFIWKKPADEILTKIKRGRAALTQQINPSTDY